MHDGLIERDGKDSCSSPCYSWQLPRTPMRRSCRPVDREAGSTGSTGTTALPCLEVTVPGGARQMFRAVCMLIRFRDEHLSMFVSMELVDHRKYCPVEIYEICSAIFLYMWIYIPFLVSSDPKKKTNKPWDEVNSPTSQAQSVDWLLELAQTHVCLMLCSPKKNNASGTECSSMQQLPDCPHKKPSA